MLFHQPDKNNNGCEECQEGQQDGFHRKRLVNGNNAGGHAGKAHKRIIIDPSAVLPDLLVAEDYAGIIKVKIQKLKFKNVKV